MTVPLPVQITDLPAADRQTGQPAIGDLLFRPNISLNGSIDAGTLSFLMERLEKVRADDDDLRMELNTLGGDADVARRIALEIRLFRKHSGRRAWCVGKTNIYSAGVTIFAAFATQNRFLTTECGAPRPRAEYAADSGAERPDEVEYTDRAGFARNAEDCRTVRARRVPGARGGQQSYLRDALRSSVGKLVRQRRRGLWVRVGFPCPRMTDQLPKEAVPHQAQQPRNILSSWNLPISGKF
jgi:hypothetical protein